MTGSAAGGADVVPDVGEPLPGEVRVTDGLVQHPYNKRLAARASRDGVAAGEDKKMMKMFAAVVAAVVAVGCGGHSPTAPSMTSTGSISQTSATGTWTGSASDSSSSLGAGAMMGQSGMGTVTWQLSQSGSAVTGTMSVSGMQGRMPGSFTGTMTGNDMTFTMDMPMNSMMSSGCSARATGTAHLDPTTMTMACTYNGTNSCSGPFGNGQMTMARR